jgi:uncharacterized protein
VSTSTESKSRARANKELRIAVGKLVDASRAHSIAADKLSAASRPVGFAWDKHTDPSCPPSIAPARLSDSFSRRCTATENVTAASESLSTAVDSLTNDSDSLSIAVDTLTNDSESLSIAIGSLTVAWFPLSVAVGTPLPVSGALSIQRHWNAHRSGAAILSLLTTSSGNALCAAFGAAVLIGRIPGSGCQRIVTMTHFTPIPALVGGLLIGAAATALLVVNGRIAGISGILGGLARREPGEAAWRWSFVAGLVAGGLLLRLVHPAVFGPSPASLPVLGIAGLLVGAGTRMSGGCTSGHGVCGTARGSLRSVVATVVFIAAGAAVVLLIRHRGGP